jgi:hypothetical protein
MLIRPRQQILDAWEAITRLAENAGGWRWGGRDGRNSVSDAEQLLCLLGPATAIPPLGLADPDRTADDVTDALRAIGSRTEIPAVVLRLTLDYLDTYAAADGTPVFAGGSRFVVVPGVSAAVTAEQREFEVVDSFAVSVTLTLAALGFARTLRPVLTRADLLGQVEDLRIKAARRLTAALVGLLRSFSVNVFAPDSEFGVRQLRRVNQDGRPLRVVIDDLRAQLQRIHVRFRDDIILGSGAAESSALDPSEQLFECGWSWSVVREAPRITLDGALGAQGQRDGPAENAPYLYFTAVALDAIEELFSPRTQLLNLLDSTQQRLANALELRHQLTHAFWACIATFGTGGRWPVEDVPWQATDGLQNEYYSVLISGMFVQERIKQPAADPDLARVGAIYAEQARRSRITRRAVARDINKVAAHDPGEHEPLRGSDAGDPQGAASPQLAWMVSDIAPLLLDRSLRLAGHFDAGAARTRVLDLADRVWEHMLTRRIEAEPVHGLWDQPRRAFPEVPGVATHTEVSWYHTKRMIDCLVSAGRIVSEPPRPSPDLARSAHEMLIEADHLLHVEFYREPGRRGQRPRDDLEAVGSLLEQARAVVERTPGVAVALAGEALTMLHRRAQARAYAARSTEP